MKSCLNTDGSKGICGSSPNNSVEEVKAMVEKNNSVESNSFYDIVIVEEIEKNGKIVSRKVVEVLKGSFDNFSTFPINKWNIAA